MRVLLYIPKSKNTDMKALFASALTEEMDKFATVSVCSTLPQVRKMTKEHASDILHIIGCNTIHAYQALRIAEKHGILVVVSPLGDLMPWNRNASDKAGSTFYQEKMIREADAIHVGSEMEQELMKTLAWNTRQELVRNSIVTNQITQRQMVFAMFRLYQKVIDSNTFRLMSDDEKQMENILLRCGLWLTHHDPNADEALFYPLSPEDPEGKRLIGNLSEESLRKILLHANDENVIDYVRTGAEHLRIQTQSVDIDNIDRFEQKLKKPHEPLPTDRLSARHAMKNKIRFDHLRQDEKPSDIEMALCYLFVNVDYALQRHTLTRRHLAQLYSLLRYKDYDEDKLERMLSRLQMKPFASHILQIMHESLGLEEGFMPIAPKNNKTTDSIRRKLQNINIQ